MFINFSRRHHLDKPEYDLKYKYVPLAFRMDLYKHIIEDCDSTIQEYCIYRDVAININKESVRLYSRDEMEEFYNPDLFIDLLLQAEWHEVLSIVEFLLNIRKISVDEANQLFEYHNLGYRIEKELLWGGKNKVEVYYDKLIEDNDILIDSDIPYSTVIESIKSAKKYLVNPNNIDVSQSVKASICAIEGYLKGYFEGNGKKCATLDDCIKELGKDDLCPDRILKSLKELYIYRNSEKNVGHGSPHAAKLTAIDALLCNHMAISFINYFHRKFSE